MAAPPSVPQNRRVWSERFVQLVATLRLYLRDFPELNRLTEGVESSNRVLAWALLDALEDFNTTPPWVSSYTIDNFPYVHLLIRGAAANVLESVGLLQTRNHLPFSDGGIQVGVSSKTPLIQGWINMFRSSYEQKKAHIKVAENIEGGWGMGVHSDYFYVNGTYGFF